MAIASTISRRTALLTGLAAASLGRASRATDVLPAPLQPTARPHVELSGGRPITPDFRQIDPKTGQQKGYVVLAPDERAKGFVRPVRLVYTHVRCGTDTAMSRDIAETFARDPSFYRTTFCMHERAQFPLAEFVWKGTDITVGS
jgi:hypothetical protein